jgi:hypothetical protein
MFIYIQWAYDQACYCELTESTYLQKVVACVPANCVQLCCCKVMGSDFVVVLTDCLLLDTQVYCTEFSVSHEHHVKCKVPRTSVTKFPKIPVTHGHTSEYC